MKGDDRQASETGELPGRRPLPGWTDRARVLFHTDRLRRVPAWARWVLGLAIALAALHFTRAPTPGRTNPPVPDGYAALARALADDSRVIPDAPAPKTTWPM
jgi:hypothetical protein